MGFRLAFGDGRCSSGATSTDQDVRDLCARIVARREALRSRPSEHLRSLPELQTERERVNSRLVVLSTYADPVPSGELLLVVQGFLPTWRFPKYIGVTRIGRMYAEGLVVATDGSGRDAEDDYMWGHR